MTAQLFLDLIESTDQFDQLKIIYDIVCKKRLQCCKKKIIPKYRDDELLLDKLFTINDELTLADLFQSLCETDLDEKQQTILCKILFRRQSINLIKIFLDIYTNIDPFKYYHYLYAEKFYNLVPYLNRAPYMKDKIVPNIDKYTFVFYVNKYEDVKACIEFGMKIDHIGSNGKSIIDVAYMNKQCSAKTFKYLLDLIDHEKKEQLCRKIINDLFSAHSKAKRKEVIDFIRKNPFLLKVTNEIKNFHGFYYADTFHINPFQSLFYQCDSDIHKHTPEMIEMIRTMIEIDCDLIHRPVVKDRNGEKSLISLLEFLIEVLFTSDHNTECSSLRILVDLDHSILFYKRRDINKYISSQYDSHTNSIYDRYRQNRQILLDKVVKAININCQIPSLKTLILSKFYDAQWKPEIPKYFPKLLFYNESNRIPETSYDTSYDNSNKRKNRLN